MRGNPGVVGGICPNPQCKKKLYFPSHEASVECTGCGQRHTQSGLKNVGLTEWYGIGAIERLLQELQKESHRTATINQELPKVNGLSNYLCTILSPLLTTYGMDRTTGRAKLLTEMGKSPFFDCAQLGDRAFLIDPQHLTIPGYGRDRSGSDIYLKDTLEHIKVMNENEERLIPIHADGDGHCLVHAVSRALVGWELFWHPLRVNLKQHFVDNLSKYKMQFQDFIDDSEWNLIIRECDPEFVPNGAEPTGLRNIHIFGLANVLKRPIILLDSLEGIKSPGDYSAIFLPYFLPPSECMNKEGVLNKPLCIAWSSLGRNHFIPLVGVKGRKCPVLSRHMIYRTWGVSDSEIDKYVAFDGQGNFQIGGEKVLQSGYLQRLVAAMSDIFLQQNGVSASLIADVYQQIFKANGLVFGMNLNLLLEKTKNSITDKQLFVCLTCWCLALLEPIREDWLQPEGELYKLAVSCHGNLKDGQKYSFPLHGVVAEYSASQNKLISRLSCDHCGNINIRLVQADYAIEYINGDRTSTKSSISPSGFKHFWNGKEYDTVPKQIPVVMEWGDCRLETTVQWFQDEEDQSLNSNVYNIAMSLVQDNFPGEFGSERLVQKVVDQILRQTNKPETDKSIVASAVRSNSAGSSMDEDDPGAWSPHRASKAILSGMQRQSIHKEELNKSAAERQLRQRIESNAPKQQRKLSNQTERKHSSPSPEPISRKTPERRMSSPSSLSSSNVMSSSLSSQTMSATTSLPLISGGSDTTQETVSTNKRIRLSTSDGRNITLDLPSECKFLELQSLICQAISVPPPQQRIRHGFPPRELKPPTTSADDYRVPVQPGDKIMLDILTPKQETSKPFVHETSHSYTPDKSKIHGLPARREELNWNSFAEGGVDEASDRVLQGLMDPMWTSGGDSLDHSLSALALTAALDNKDLWTYVQLRPHLFSVNGLFYKQVERDVGMKHGKHCQLPQFLHKVFVYNQFDDRLELCLEPYGHFPIECNVEKNAGSMLPTSKCSSKSTHQPFSGQGHSLRSATSQEERMPLDVPMSPKRHEARRLNTMCDPAVHQESIEEEDEEVEETEMKEEDSAVSKLSTHRLSPSLLSRNFPLSWGTPTTLNLLMTPESRLIRKGPGYSELSPIPENASNEKTEMLQQLVSRIEQACETMGHEAQKISEAAELSPRRVFSPITHSPLAARAPPAECTTDTSNFAPLICTSSSLSHCPSQKSIAKSNIYDIKSFMIPASHITQTDNESLTSSIGDSSLTLISQPFPHSGTDGENSSTVFCGSHCEVTTTLMSPLVDKHTSEIPCECQDEKPSEENSFLLGQTTPVVTFSEHIPALEEITDDIKECPCIKGESDHIDQDKMEADTNIMKTEGQDPSFVQRDTDCTKDDHTPMEDNEDSREEGASKVLDDLFIEELPPDMPMCDQDLDSPKIEIMDSP